VGVVKAIIGSGEGHDDYLARGCLTGTSGMRRET
jgi:hypothetical protein